MILSIPLVVFLGLAEEYVVWFVLSFPILLYCISKIFANRTSRSSGNYSNFSNSSIQRESESSSSCDGNCDACVHGIPWDNRSRICGIGK
jgi:hypothetical protein